MIKFLERPAQFKLRCNILPYQNKEVFHQDLQNTRFSFKLRSHTKSSRRKVE